MTVRRKLPHAVRLDGISRLQVLDSDTRQKKNYLPVEGEALAVAWALEDTRFFTLGCSELKLIIAH